MLALATLSVTVYEGILIFDLFRLPLTGTLLRVPTPPFLAHTRTHGHTHAHTHTHTHTRTRAHTLTHVHARKHTDTTREQRPGIAKHAVGCPEKESWIDTPKKYSAVQFEYIAFLVGYALLAAAAVLRPSTWGASLFFYWILPHMLGAGSVCPTLFFSRGHTRARVCGFVFLFLWSYANPPLVVYAYVLNFNDERQHKRDLTSLKALALLPDSRAQGV